MAQIALVDLPPDTLGGLTARHSIRAHKTRWNSGGEDLTLAADTQILFINAAYPDATSLALHNEVHQAVQALFDRGGAVFVFVGQTCTNYHIHNLVRIPPLLQIGNSVQNPTQCTVMEWNRRHWTLCSRGSAIE